MIMLMIITHNDKCISAAGLQGKGLHDTVFADTVWPSIMLRSVFKISCLFLRPRLWQFEN